MGLKKVSFGITTIQKLRRITLDQNLLDSLGLAVGDSVRVELDVEQETVHIKSFVSPKNNSFQAANTTGVKRVKK